MSPRFQRYVALGDSTTEGLEDPYEDGSGYRGWADRLAEALAAANPELTYANLAIRGRKVPQIRAEQLEPALALRPDLASIVGGSTTSSGGGSTSTASPMTSRRWSYRCARPVPP